MNLKTWIPLALAIVLGFVAMKIARDAMSKRPGGEQTTQNLTDVVVVKHNLPAGASLKPDDLVISKISADVQPEGIFRNPNELNGRVVKQALRKGQPVMETLLAPTGTGSGLQAIVPKGMRAITMEINEFSGLAGFLVAGCRVDIVSTINGDNGETLSRTIVQNVEVTALGKHQPAADGQPEQIRSVTMLVNPKQAEAVELAAATGRPRLVLRGSGDDTDANTVGITVAELRGRSSRRQDPWTLPAELFTPRPTGPTTAPTTVSPVMDMTPAPQRTIKVIRAGSESEVTIDLPRGTYDKQTGKWMTDAKQ